MSRVWTMVARAGKGKEHVDDFTIISNDYEIQKVSEEALRQVIRNNTEKFTNLGLDENGRVVSTNGAMNKYTYFNTVDGRIEGKARPVILSRVEKEGKLVGYVVFTHTGQVKECNVPNTVSLYNTYGISNGKIRHTESGDIISSINGVFPLREIEVEKSSRGTITAEIKFMCEARKINEVQAIRYVGALISGTSAAKISVLLDALTESNAKVTSALVSMQGQSVRRSVEIQRVSETAFYCVFETALLDAIKKRGIELVIKKIKGDYSIIFSNMLYHEDKTFTELSARIAEGQGRKVKKIDFPEDTTAENEERFKKFIAASMREIESALK